MSLLWISVSLSIIRIRISSIVSNRGRDKQRGINIY